jgi:hypothetical protein
MNYFLRAFAKAKRTTCNSECIVMLFLKISLLKQFRANFYMCRLVTYIVTWCPCYSVASILSFTLNFLKMWLYAHDFFISGVFGCFLLRVQPGYSILSCSPLFQKVLVERWMDTTNLEIFCKYSICYGLWYWDIIPICSSRAKWVSVGKAHHLVVCAFSTRLIYVALFHSVHVDTRFPP